MILGLDLGTLTGWCLADGTHYRSGVFNNAGNRFAGGGMRYVNFDTNLKCLLPGVTQVFFEEVRRHMGVDAAHCYGAFMGGLMALCEREGIPYAAIPVATIKRVATGKGNANKAAMLVAAQSRWPDANISDDNEADARFIALAGTRMLAGTLPQQIRKTRKTTGRSTSTLPSCSAR